MFDLALPSKGAICLRSASVGTSATVRFSLCACICLWLCVVEVFVFFFSRLQCIVRVFVCVCVNAICLCAWRRSLKASFNLISYWDMPVTRLWYDYLVPPSAAGLVIIFACHSQQIKLCTILPIANFPHTTYSLCIFILLFVSLHLRFDHNKNEKLPRI